MGAPFALARHKLLIEDYHRMGDAGILGEDSRVELIEGELIDMAPIGSPHAGTVNTLNILLTRRAGDLAIVSVQNPVSLPPRSEPQPDVVLLAPRADCYRGTHPTPADVLLLIEVSDSSIEYDRQIKIPLYAQQGIREVWIVDIQASALHVYREPHAAGYRLVLSPARDESVSPLLLPAVRLLPSEIFPA